MAWTFCAFVCATSASCSSKNESPAKTGSPNAEDSGAPTADATSSQMPIVEGGNGMNVVTGDAAGPADVGAPAVGTQIIVEAGNTNRDHTIVSFSMPGSAGKTLLLRDAQGNRIPLQVAEDGTATFILPSLASGQQAKYTIEQPATPPAPGIAATEETNGVKLAIGASSVFRFQTKGQLPQGIAAVYLRGGYIHPLYTPGGGIVTDDYNPSHIHHHGIWSAWTSTEFNGHHVDFWNMGDRLGKVDFDALDKSWSGPVHAGFAARLLHVDLTGAQPVTALREQWIVTAYKTHESAPPYFSFDIASTQETATNAPLQLNQYIYGGFGIRGSGQWLDKAKVSFLTSEGFDRANGDSKKGRWCYIGGLVDGKTVGYATLGHPDNFRAPQMIRIHPDEPYASFAPVIEGPFNIQSGTPYKTRFRVVSFDGPPDKNLLDRLWNDYATPPKVRVEPAP